MPKKFRCKKIKNKIRWLAVMVVGPAIMFGLSAGRTASTSAASCPDVKIIFARGSGGERYTNEEYNAFKDALSEKLSTSSLKYEFDDLDYSAVSIDVNGHFDTLLGAFFGGGEAYEFGDSVREGVANLLNEVNNSSCKNTKYVFGGYSQGALVVMNAIDEIDADKVIFAATFGDPKIYLPEGEGPVPPACAGRNLSDYRAYVPDCRAYKGLIGAREPYTMSNYIGKVGTWCNKYDLLCSSHFDIISHTSYVQDGLYEDASRYIFSKIVTAFGIDGNYTSPHDTAIMIDSTGSMENLIGRYKGEAMRLAEETLNKGGRVALYDYRDLVDGYTPVERCNFETCTLESFQEGLNQIVVDGGGDEPESLLSSSFQVMKQLNWNFGSTKSLVVLTDAGYHSPDLDGTTFYDVEKLSKQIDPVNFYIVTNGSNTETYRELAEATGGAVASSVEELSLIVDAIMEKFDSLPRVEEEFEGEDNNVTLPVIEINNVEWVAQDNVKVSYDNSGEMAVVILNDGILGTTKEKEFTITGLKNDVNNILTLVPLSNEWRGEAVTVSLSEANGMGGSDSNDAAIVVVPKAPDTGIVKK